MTHYILQILAFQFLFLVVYDLFLKKETFFKWNRAYLLLTPMLSFILPLVKLDLIRDNIPAEFLVQLPAIVLGKNTSGGITSETLEAVSINTSNSWGTSEIFQMLWIIGLLVSMVIFCVKLYRLEKFKRRGEEVIINNTKIISLSNTDTAFSFFNTIFLGDQLSDAQKLNILLHEKIHVAQYHSIDLLFFEILRIVFWFNPLIYVYQNKMVLLQEFTADAAVAAQNGKHAYYQDLLSQVFNTESISFVNTFFNHSLIKKRILMLQKSKSRKIFQLKYLLLLPVVCMMLVYTSCSDEKVEDQASLASNSETEVMDKINELGEAIMKKGNLSDEEMRALKFLSTEAKPGDKIYESIENYLEETKFDSEGKVSFATIEKAPVYPGCEGLDNEAAKKCFSQKISQFIGDNFKVDNIKDSGIIGRQKITTKFIINKEGKVVVKEIKANHPALEAAARLALNQLPEMIPGEQNGKKVAVEYTLPIISIY
jgi:bla regulator protein BlaR1